MRFQYVVKQPDKSHGVFLDYNVKSSVSLIILTINMAKHSKPFIWNPQVFLPI